MKSINPFKTLILAGCLFFFAKADCLAVQYDYHPIERLSAKDDASDYIRLGTESQEYEVKPGDTLWGISGKLLGSGTRCAEIVRQNRGIIEQGYLIRPGDLLTVSESLYIPKDRYDRGGLVSGGAFHIAMPDMVEHSLFMTNTLNEGDIFGSDISVYSTPVTNHMGENALTASEQDWNAFTADVTRCSENCGGRVSGLTFEKYTVENGCDLCGYSFDFDTGETIMEYVVFYRLGERNMAEVIGKRAREPGKARDTRLIDVTRYIAASFEDFGGRAGMGRTKMADNVGAWDWDYPELHNLFTSAMDNYVVCARRPDKNYPDNHEILWTEPAFEQAVRSALIQLWQLDGEETEAFLARPVTAGDLAVITDIECTLYGTGSRKAGDDPLAAGGPVLYFTCNGHLEKIYPGKDSIFSYEDLGHFTEAETFVMSGCEPEDLSFLVGMEHLKELSLSLHTTVENVDFLASLKELRLLQLLGTYAYAEGAPAGFLKIEDLSVLKNCGQLRYLYLQTPLVSDFSFLEDCPEICTMYLAGQWDGKEQVIPDLELLPNARFLDFYEENYRFEP